MKKVLSIVLAIALVSLSALFLVACSEDADKSSTTVTGLNYTFTKDKTAGDGYIGFATVKKYVLDETQTKAVAKGNYARNMIDLTIESEVETDDGKYKVNAIADAAFANQLLIKKVTVKEGIETIGAGCFAGCSNLEEVTVPFVGASLDAVNDKKTFGYLFGTSESSGCTSTTVYYNGGDTDNSATYYIPNGLKKITVTGDVVSDYAFNGLNVNTIVLSGAVKEIGEGSFANMGKIASIDLPAQVESIDKAAFKGTSSLLAVNFDELTSLKVIGEDAFRNCSKLGYNKAINLPEGIEIGENAFKGCEKLDYIKFKINGSYVDEDEYGYAFDKDFFKQYT